MKSLLVLLFTSLATIGYAQMTHSPKDTTPRIFIRDSICKETGRVVLEITTDSLGNIIEMKAGRGTTNLSKCLTAQAYIRAKKMKFTPKNQGDRKMERVIFDFKREEQE